MIKLNFNLRNPKSKKETPIVLVIRYEGETLVYATKLKINPNDWDLKNQIAREGSVYGEYKLFNSRLKYIYHQTNKLFYKYYLKNETYPMPKQLRDILDAQLFGTPPALSIEKLSLKDIELKVPGVYFLFNNGTLNYIGKSNDVISRVHSHRFNKTAASNHRIPFNEAKYLKCDMGEATQYEAKLIAKYNPPYNISCRTRSYVTDKIKNDIKEKLDKNVDKETIKREYVISDYQLDKIITEVNETTEILNN